MSGAGGRKGASGARDSLTKEKVISFSIGQQKKTRFQKEKEAAEAKRKKEEAEAASVYDDFVASFGAGGGGGGGGRGRDGPFCDPNAKTFMRGGLAHQPTAQAPAAASSEGSTYTLEARRPSKPPSEMDRMLEEMQSQAAAASASNGLLPLPMRTGSGGPGGPGSNRKSGKQIDDFLAELRGNAAEGGGGGGGKPAGFGGDAGGLPLPSLGPGGARGAVDDGDPTSTNLYLGNLAPSVTEEGLQEIFSRFGEIYSIKIMWPRTDEERARKRNCGFVSFWRRQDAEAAKNAMMDEMVEDYRMTIGWGKPINKLAHRIGDETRVSEEPPPPDVPDPSLPQELLAQRELIAKAQAAAKAAMAAAMVAVSSGGSSTAPQPAAGAAAAATDAPPAPVAAAASGAGSSSRWGSVSSDGADAASKASSPSPPPPLRAASGEASPPGGQPAGSAAAAAFAAAAAVAAKLSAAAAAPQAVKVEESTAGAASASATSGEPEAAKTDQVVPTVDDKARRHFLDRLARYVAKDGALFEAKIREREAGNPEFGFLYDTQSPDGVYYRWRVFAFLMGDKEHKWREEPFKMVPGGRLWVPPPLPKDVDAGDQAEKRKQEQREKERKREREREQREREVVADVDKTKYMTGRQLEKLRDRERGRDRGRVLGDREFELFSEMLRELTHSRHAIADAMAFALDNADAASELAEVLKEALLVAETPVPVKLARLYLLSDILHNSSAPVRNASRYRMYLQSALPDIFEALNATMLGVEGRFTARQLRERVMSLLAIWESWSLYPPLFLAGLEATFLRQPSVLEAVDVGEVSEDDLDFDMLCRRARMAGLATKDLTAMQLLRRLTHLNNYAKDKAAGRGPLDPAAAAASSAVGAEGGGCSSGGGIAADALREAVVQSEASAAAAQQPQGPGGVTGAVWSVAVPEAGSDEDDLDGVPMDEAATASVPLAAAGAGTADTGASAGGDSDDEDIDGVPLADVAPAAAAEPSAGTGMSDGKKKNSSSKVKGGKGRKRRRASGSSALSATGGRTWSGSDSSAYGTASGDESDASAASKASLSSSASSAAAASVFAEEAARQAERRVGLLELTPREEEDKRIMLRRAETEALKLRDKLEASGLGLGEDEVRRRVDAKRGDIISEWECELQEARAEAAAAVAAAEKEKERQKKAKDAAAAREKERDREKARDRERKERDRRRSRSRERERRRSSRSRSRERRHESSSRHGGEGRHERSEKRSERSEGSRGGSKRADGSDANGGSSKKRSRGGSRSRSNDRGSRRSKHSASTERRRR